ATSALYTLSLHDALPILEHYNNVRLNSAIGYITPKDMLAGHQQEIQAERDRKVDAAKEQRKNRRQGAARRMQRIAPVSRHCRINPAARPSIQSTKRTAALP